MARLDEDLYSDESETDVVRVSSGPRSSMDSDKGGDGREGDMDEEDNGKNTGAGEEDEILSSLMDKADAEAAIGGNVKPKQRRPRFTEDHVIGPRGLERIYTTFPSLCAFRGEGHEAQDLHRLLRCYKEWAHQLFPQLAFEDLLDRVQNLSGKARVRRCLEDMRETERERYLAANFGNDYEDKMAEYRRKKAKEEARLEAERVRRREEMYGIGRKRAGEEGGKEGEVAVEDLGAVEDVEEKERRRQERRERIAAELAAKAEARRIEKEREKKQKQLAKQAAKQAARVAKRKTKSTKKTKKASDNGDSSSESAFDAENNGREPSGRLRRRTGASLGRRSSSSSSSSSTSSSSSSSSSSSEGMETEDSQAENGEDAAGAGDGVPRVKRARLEGDHEGTEKLRALLVRYFEEGKYQDIRVSEILRTAQEDFGLVNHEPAVLKSVVMAMIKEIARKNFRRRAREERAAEKLARSRQKEEARAEARREKERRKEKKRQRRKALAARKKLVTKATRQRRAAAAAASKAWTEPAAPGSEGSDKEREGEWSDGGRKEEPREGPREGAGERLPVSRAAMTTYLEDMLTGVSLEDTSTKTILTSLRTHFELDIAEFAAVRGPAREILSEIVTRVMSLSQLEEEEGNGVTLPVETGEERVPGSPEPFGSGGLGVSPPPVDDLLGQALAEVGGMGMGESAGEVFGRHGLTGAQEEEDMKALFAEFDEHEEDGHRRHLLEETSSPRGWRDGSEDLGEKNDGGEMDEDAGRAAGERLGGKGDPVHELMEASPAMRPKVTSPSMERDEDRMDVVGDERQAQVVVGADGGSSQDY